MSKSFVCFFRFAIIAAAACIVLCFSAGQGLSADTMDFDTVANMARDLAQAPFKSRQELDLPKMEYEQFHEILFRPDRAVWKNEKLPLS